MKKFFLSVIFTIILGIFVGKELCTTISAKEYKTLYILEIGSYLDYNDALRDTSMINNKIIMKDSSSYDVYIGASFNKSNLNKLMKIYKKYNFTYFIKEEEIRDKEFIKNMNNFDLIMKSSKKNSDILEINGIILSYFEEKFIK